MKYLLGLLIGLSIIFTGCVNLKQTEFKEKFPEVSVPETEVRTLYSDAIGQEYAIFIGLPHHYLSTDTTYPLLFVLDANAEFAMLVQILRMMQITQDLPELLVVGIGYTIRHDTTVWALRSRDLTPTHDPKFDAETVEHMPGMPDFVSGGAPKFLQFIHQDLIPFIQKNYRIDINHKTLIGHSFGGLFGCYVLFTKPEMFSNYILGSPSIWWDDEILFEMEKSYADRHNDLPHRVFMSVGYNEPESANMVSNMKKMANRLKSRTYSRLDLKTCIFQDEIHMSVIPVTFSRGLRYIYNVE